MTTNQHRYLLQLREFDPEAGTTYSPSSDPVAQALLERIIADRTGLPVTPAPPLHSRRRRFAVGSTVVAAAVAALVTAGVVTRPGSHAPASAAWAATANPDGSIEVRINWKDLDDPAALNARLSQLGVRAVVMTFAPLGQCKTPVLLDPAKSVFHATGPDVEQQIRQQLANWWVVHPDWSGSEQTEYVIYPNRIPSGDYGVIANDKAPGTPYATTPMKSMAPLVTSVPPCFPRPEESTYTRSQIVAN